MHQEWGRRLSWCISLVDCGWTITRELMHQKNAWVRASISLARQLFDASPTGYVMHHKRTSVDGYLILHQTCRTPTWCISLARRSLMYHAQLMAIRPTGINSSKKFIHSILQRHCPSRKDNKFYASHMSKDKRMRLVGKRINEWMCASVYTAWKSDKFQRWWWPIKRQTERQGDQRKAKQQECKIESCKWWFQKFPRSAKTIT